MKKSVIVSAAFACIATGINGMEQGGFNASTYDGGGTPSSSQGYTASTYDGGASAASNHTENTEVYTSSTYSGGTAPLSPVTDEITAQDSGITEIPDTAAEVVDNRKPVGFIFNESIDKINTTLEQKKEETLNKIKAALAEWDTTVAGLNPVVTELMELNTNMIGMGVRTIAKDLDRDFPFCNVKTDLQNIEKGIGSLKIDGTAIYAQLEKSTSELKEKTDELQKIVNQNMI